MRDYAGTLPVLLDLDLLQSGWDGSVEPYPGITERQFAMQSQRRSLLKKFSDNKSSKADANALSLFKSVNERCRSWNLDTAAMSEFDTIAIGEAKAFIRAVCEEYDPDTGVFQPVLRYHKIAAGFGVGNGANIGSPGTDLISKVGLSTMSATSHRLHDLFVKAIPSPSQWSDVESIRSQHRGYEVVQGSRLSFVPKTTEISRTICTEPLCNMLFQKGIAAILEKRIRQVVSIDLSNQADKNRLLAQLGSKTGQFGTIDLSSASDSMSSTLVREFFPDHVVQWLEIARSPVTILPDGSVEELHMVSSMGNAFTFPLQTLLFASLVYGVYRAYGIQFRRPDNQSLGNFAVFGDDIIVLGSTYGAVVRLLCLCGFSVNVDKSFNEGFFRESCGRDYYLGYNVRGVYIKTLKNDYDRYSAINRLNVWSATHGIYLQHTLSYLLKGQRFLPVPFDEMDVAGIKVHSSHLKRPRFSRYTGGIIYRYVALESPSVSVTDVGARPPRLKGWFDNHPAILFAALAGVLRSGKVVPRVIRPSTRYRQRASSRWNWIPIEQRVNAAFGEKWKLFVEINLNLS